MENLPDFYSYICRLNFLTACCMDDIVVQGIDRTGRHLSISFNHQLSKLQVQVARRRQNEFILG